MLCKGFYKVSKKSESIHTGIVQMLERKLKGQEISVGRWGTFGPQTKTDDFGTGCRYGYEVLASRRDGMIWVEIFDRKIA